MDISEVRVKLVRDPGERLKAVCIVTFDEAFVVRDVKVVDGTNGLFVAMPSQKLAVHCPKCRQKNHLRARFCNECGKELPSHSVPWDANGRSTDSSSPASLAGASGPASMAGASSLASED